MKEIISIYKKQYSFIENSLTAMIESVDTDAYDTVVKESLFSLFPALQATYKISKNLKQITPLYTPQEDDKTYLGLNKSHLLERIQFRDDNIYISNVYVNSRSATPYITAVHFVNDEYFVYDFELYTLLKELSLVEGHEYFSKFTQYFYGIFGFLLSLFSFSLIVYAFYTVWLIFAAQDTDILSGLFRSIIALTLALAIFDLSKTILEHEVFYKSISREYNIENKLLARFLTSIIIALSIESLMVVFKIALSDYEQMIHAFYLIAGVGIMVAVLSLFIFVMRYSNTKE
ncbi:hypothetical protein FJR45_09870 [Sulfurimonas sediminis]|uniref:General glycosylation pathway protein n=1 Tax=Sulfurimonas sediminis TaxID=2590020 RepID=A0A7M1B3C4_9BACT|nr:hypothetical protein [Sulfurimonas sediminis]QOP44233.1 hypothetical protein FJR45_09870 [Sulfurimonas sediminis]